MRVTVLGLTLSSSWGNGHATTYRALLRALAARGHEIVFLERDQPWYAAHRDLADPDFCTLVFYSDLDELGALEPLFAEADAVVVGSYVPQGVEVGRMICSRAPGARLFYDIDTPVTLAKLARGDFEYLSPDLVREFDLYFSFTGGPTLRRLEQQWGARSARALYCSADVGAYEQPRAPPLYDLGYLGTYSEDRQPALERLLIEPARLAPEKRFVVAGPQYPATIAWPHNVTRLEHVAPKDHAAFYRASRFTLNVTREDMRRAGYSPSVRLFEAAAAGAPILSDSWPGLEDIFQLEREILVVQDARDVLAILNQWPESRRRALAQAARSRVLAAHTAAHRALTFENGVREALVRRHTAQTGRTRAVLSRTEPV